MKDITSWKVYDYTTNSGSTGRVLVGYSVATGPIIEEVTSSSEGFINGYKLYGGHNHYFENAEQVWMEYRAKHDINSIKDVSAEFE